MFMITLSKAGLRRLGAVALCGVVLAGAAVAGRFAGSRAVQTAAPVPAAIETTQDIVGYFTGYGLEADPASVTADKVKIPRKWDDSFAAFNTVVAQSGLDLAKYKGKTVEKWLAMIPAQSTGGTQTYGVLLVYKKKAVGAYLLQKPSGTVMGMADAAAAQAAADAAAAAQPETDPAAVAVDLNLDSADGYPAD